MTTNKAIVTLLTGGLLLFASCHRSHEAANSDANPDSVAGKTGKVAYSVAKGTEKVAKVVGKETAKAATVVGHKVSEAAHNAKEGWKEAAAEDKAKHAH